MEIRINSMAALEAQSATWNDKEILVHNFGALDTPPQSGWRKAIQFRLPPSVLFLLCRLERGGGELSSVKKFPSLARRRRNGWKKPGGGGNEPRPFPPLQKIRFLYTSSLSLSLSVSTSSGNQFQNLEPIVLQGTRTWALEESLCRRGAGHSITASFYILPKGERFTI